ncbi:unnamed protein product [Linum trigynum]|uniref:SWIM-type domain-containing protein n=1 Tax=Linum trigynum TaxID=586398 RepID=A0AAV2E7D3_9ROSI
MSAGGVVFQEVVINDDDAVMMMLQFLSDNQVRLAEVYVETEAVGESHSHQYSYDDGFAGGYEWGGSSSNYQGGGYTRGYGEGGHNRQTVKLHYELGECSCQKYQNERIPCSHAMAVAKSITMNRNSLVSPYYPEIGSPVRIATSLRVIVISPSGRWNVWVSGRHRSAIAVSRSLSISIRKKWRNIPKPVLAM